jgi:hypothetical protein
MEAKGKAIYSEVKKYARSAFAVGYARHTDIVTDEAKQECLDAIQYAVEHVDDDNVMRVVEQMGSLAGLKAISEKIK